MEKVGTLKTGLPLAALVVVVAAMGLLFLGALDGDGISLPAQEAQATEQEMEEAYQNLVDAINRKDHDEASRIAEWMDEQRGLKTHIPEIIQDWCALSGQEWDFCKEKNDAKE